MDQMVSSIGIHRKAFFLDCLSLKFELIDLPEDWVFCLVNSAVQRTLRDSAYNERFNQLKKAEEYLGIEYLGSIKPNQFDEAKINDKVILSSFDLSKSINTLSLYSSSTFFAILFKS